MTAKRLMELSAEYLAYEDDAATLNQFGRTPDRTPDEIAAEYGRVLREFQASEA